MKSKARKQTKKITSYNPTQVGVVSLILSIASLAVIGQFLAIIAMIIAIIGIFMAADHKDAHRSNSLILNGLALVIGLISATFAVLF